MESHGFSCHLGTIAFAIGKIAFAHAITLPIAHAIIPKSHSNPCYYPYQHCTFSVQKRSSANRLGSLESFRCSYTQLLCLCSRCSHNRVNMLASLDFNLAFYTKFATFNSHYNTAGAFVHCSVVGLSCAL